jgi:hypothetical protein
MRVEEKRNAVEKASPQSSKPNPALKRLDKLVGTWNLKGRTLDSTDDSISGRTTIEWLPGEFFLQQRGEIEFMGFRVQSLEIVGYDASTKTFSSYVYSNMGEVPLRYHWDVQGDVVTHWTKGSKYTGRFSKDGKVLSGGWRPEEGVKKTLENTYDAVMTRVR